MPPSSHASPTRHPGQTSVVNTARTGFSRSARRRFRRASGGSTGRKIETCWTPLPDDSPPTDATRDLSRNVGDFSATSFMGGVRPVAKEQVRDHGTYSVQTKRVLVQLSPAQQQRQFKRVLAARDRQLVANDQRSQANIREEATRRRARGAGGEADVSALERRWGVLPLRSLSGDVDIWDTNLILLSTVPDPNSLVETASHASRLLDAFSTGATPPVTGALSTTQQQLLSTALTTILQITDNPNAHADAVVQTDPLPPPVDVTMRPDATCVVCFVRLVDTVLVPCWHLVLCEVCIGVLASIASANGCIGRSAVWR